MNHRVIGTTLPVLEFQPHLVDLRRGLARYTVIAAPAIQTFGTAHLRYITVNGLVMAMNRILTLMEQVLNFG
jgi:hypothetical protein